MPESGPRTCDIAIIGAGFCGTLIAAHLIRKSPGPLKIILIDKGAVPARGVAYGTLDPTHILNVPANQMGAYPDQPDHFYTWLDQHQASWRHLDPTFANLELKASSYLPRHLYGFYLSNVLKEACEDAADKDVQLDLMHEEAVDIQRTLCDMLEISLATGGKVEAPRVILAVGMPGGINFCAKDLPNYTANLWTMKRENPLSASSLADLPKDYTVGILGTGLTMLDAVVSLLERNYPGRIVAISKHGKLPEVHKTHAEIPFDAYDPHNPPKTSLGIFKALRKSVEKTEDWRSVIDAFRPHAIPTWLQLPIEERKKAFKWLLSHWNRHRHRMPGLTGSIAQELIQEGRLELRKGNLLCVESLGNQLSVKTVSSGTDKPYQLVAHQVINCTGPELKLENSPSLLLQNLLKRGLIAPHPTGIGVAVSLNGTVPGSLEDRLFIIGQLRMGELFESTAVPELRVQCAQLADLSIKVGV